MSVKWTKQQQDVIDVKNREVLVSAAAGSGKTAVLVEHIIQKVTDKENPIDIDELLVVTFTSAAAAEMRERIRKAMEQKAKENIEDAHIQKQLTYIHQAKITTIDSFCLDLIKEHFDQIDLDPSFRVGDTGELQLLKTDIVKEMLEDFYEENDSEFITFVESYTTKNDMNLEDMILEMYKYSTSYPDENEWFQNCLKNYEATESVDSLEWIKYLKSMTKKYFEELESYYKEIIKLRDIYPGTEKRIATIEEEFAIVQKINQAESYEEIRKVLSLFEGKRIGSCTKEVPKEIADSIKNFRDIGKNLLKDFKDDFYSQNEEEIMHDLEITKARFEMLLKLVFEFKRRFQNTKKEKNILDFNDMEHFALQILVKKENGEFIPTELAKELSEQFKEIIIDEYQDSNLVQETILRAISKENQGQPNIFMVGDVKQSIYKFRLARPELFMDKYQRYEMLPTDSNYIKIMLDRNFRSRDCILDSVNEIFYKIMQKELGNIEYDEANALHLGADYPNPPETQNQKTELILYHQESDGQNEKMTYQDLEDEADVGRIETEAYLTVQKIKELTNPENGFQVWDKDMNVYRTAKYQDIVILLRSAKKSSDVFTEILMSEGIPAYCESDIGYFDCIEITWLLNFLSIIDNPLQDIKFVSVLRSPFVGVSNVELAIIKSQTGENEYWMDRIQEYIENYQDKLQKKLRNFLDLLKNYRRMVPYTPICDIISKIIDETNYYNYILAMPAGKRRAGNINILKQKAIEYEKTSYVGLFNFIRYIEKLKKYNVDFGEAKTVGENDNTVRIMTIHKSKGLEFPIVIMPALEQKFNAQSNFGVSVFESDLGIGLEMRDPKKRIKKTTLMQKVIARKNKLEDLGEHLRILYVAMTRAKEKLIMIGSVKNIEKAQEKWAMAEQFQDGRIPFFVLASANSFLDWIGYACFGMNCKSIQTEILYASDIAISAQKNIIQREEIKQELLQPDFQQHFDENAYHIMRQSLAYTYPYYTNFGMKYSVSDIKKEQLEEVNYIFQGKKNKIIPNFIDEKEKQLSGSELGTIYHRILELYDIENGVGAMLNQQKSLLEQMVLQKKISQEMMNAVSLKKLEAFGKSSLAKRMKKANEIGKLFREKQFLLGMPASLVHKEYPNDENILIQGIIDVYFEEDGALILADYKTDKVEQLDELVTRYRIQLEYYQQALERLTQKKVKEKIIYSIYLDDEICFE